MRTRAYDMIPEHVPPQGRTRDGRTPRRTGLLRRKARSRLKKHLTIRPLIKATTACLVPLAVHAQDTSVSQPSAPTAQSAPSAQSAPTTPSVPSTPTLPTTPSQPAGIPYPASVFYPGSTYQPAGTQASTVFDEAGPGIQFRAIGGIERERTAAACPIRRT